MTTTGKIAGGPGGRQIRPEGASERISIEEFRRMVSGVRSVSGVLRSARRLWECDLSFEHGPENVTLIGRLIDQLPVKQIEEDMGRSVDGDAVRGLIRLYLIRSSQYITGEVQISRGEEDARRALSLARRIGEQDLELAALRNLGNALLAEQKNEEGEIIFRQEGVIEKERGNLEGLVRSRYNLARALIASGNRDEAALVVREGLDIYDSPDGSELPLFGKAFLLQIWQDIHSDSIDVAESIRIARQSIEILERFGMSDRLISARLGLIRCHLITNDLIGAMEEVLQIERIATPSVSPFLQCQHMIGLTAVHSALHEWESAEETGVRGLETAREIGSPALMAILLERLAEIARRRGRPDLGIIRAEEGLIVENQPLKRAYIFRLLADIHLDLDNLEEAASALSQGEELIEQIGKTDERGFFQLTRGRLCIAEGRDDDAEKILRHLRGLAIPATSVLTQSHELLANLLTTTGRMADALEEYRAFHQLVVRHEENRRDAQLLSLRTQHAIRWEHQQVLTERQEEERRRVELQSVAANLLRLRERMPQLELDLDELIDEGDKGVRRRLITRIGDHIRRCGEVAELDVLRHIRGFDDDFAGRLVETWPNLTTGQIRLASLIRAGLNSAEISDLLDISPDTLQMQRKRLRKRLNLNPGDKLEELIIRI